MPKFIPRELTVPFDTNKIITIIGPRRAGKSYFLFQLIDKIHSSGITKENFIYINFEDERLTFQNNLDTIFEAYQELYPQIALTNCYLFFDEIQKLPDWEKFIRRTYDSISKNIFLTGSNAKLLSKEIATSLRGRSLTFHILPLSFKEYLKFKGLNGEDIYSIKNRSILENELDKFLLWGSFPE
ncbi:MAG: ATPase, partial [Candidatus Cloacimonadota bacterium]